MIIIPRHNSGNPIEVSYEVMKERILSCDEEEYQALLAVLYATGFRVKEVVGGQVGEKVYKPIRYVDCYFEETTYGWFYIIRGFVTKRRSSYPLIAKPIHYEKEKWLVDIIDKYIETNKPHHEAGDKLFDITRQTAWNKCKRFAGMPPHDIRHNRTKHLLMKFNLDPLSTKNFMGWSSMAMVDHYARVNQKDVMDKLSKPFL